MSGGIFATPSTSLPSVASAPSKVTAEQKQAAGVNAADNQVVSPIPSDNSAIGANDANPSTMSLSASPTSGSASSATIVPELPSQPAVLQTAPSLTDQVIAKQKEAMAWMVQHQKDVTNHPAAFPSNALADAKTALKAIQNIPNPSTLTADQQQVMLGSLSKLTGDAFAQETTGDLILTEAALHDPSKFTGPTGPAEQAISMVTSKIAEVKPLLQAQIDSLNPHHKAAKYSNPMVNELQAQLDALKNAEKQLRNFDKSSLKTVEQGKYAGEQLSSILDLMGGIGDPSSRVLASGMIDLVVNKASNAYLFAAPPSVQQQDPTAPIAAQIRAKQIDAAAWVSMHEADVMGNPAGFPPHALQDAKAALEAIEAVHNPESLPPDQQQVVLASLSKLTANSFWLESDANLKMTEAALKDPARFASASGPIEKAKIGISDRIEGIKAGIQAQIDELKQPEYMVDRFGRPRLDRNQKRILMPTNDRNNKHLSVKQAKVNELQAQLDSLRGVEKQVGSFDSTGIKTASQGKLAAEHLNSILDTLPALGDARRRSGAKDLIAQALNKAGNVTLSASAAVNDGAVLPLVDQIHAAQKEAAAWMTKHQQDVSKFPLDFPPNAGAEAKAALEAIQNIPDPNTLGPDQQRLVLDSLLKLAANSFRYESQADIKLAEAALKDPSRFAGPSGPIEKAKLAMIDKIEGTKAGLHAQMDKLKVPGNPKVALANKPKVSELQAQLDALNDVESKMKRLDTSWIKDNAVQGAAVGNVIGMIGDLIPYFQDPSQRSVVKDQIDLLFKQLSKTA